MVALFTVFIVQLLPHFVLTTDLFTYNGLYGHIRPKIDLVNSKRAVEDLLIRLIGKEKAKSFVIKIDPQLRINDRNVFSLKKRKNSNTIRIKGTTGVEAAMGFHHYMKEYCNSHVSWDGDNINIPRELPDVNFHLIVNDWFRYYQNICSMSYSSVWWDWDRWEREIDWMVLNGFNLVLAVMGQEEIWRRTYFKLGMTFEELVNHFPGPAFLCLTSQGRLRSWTGPISNDWHKRAVALQIKVLERMRVFGITTVAPSFAGFLPREFKKLLPNAAMRQLPAWGGFNHSYCCSYILDHKDPNFEHITELYLKEFIKVFGSDHVYYIEPFIDVSPEHEDPQYVSEVGKAIYNAINVTDPHSIWIMPSTAFEHDDFWTDKNIKTFVRSVPRDVIAARKFKDSSMVGMGLTPEGIHQNYVIYQLFMEMFWRKYPTNLKKWFQNYSVRRYGKSNEALKDAWYLLMKSVYNYTGKEAHHGDYTVVRHPLLDMNPDDLWYHDQDVYRALSKLLLVAVDEPEIGESETYLTDLVDVARQALQLKINELFMKIVKAYKTRSLDTLKKTTATFKELLDDMDGLLASHSQFLLGKWIHSAVETGTKGSMKARIEEGAKYQVTIFGPHGEQRDYARKQWAGLIKDYYKPRWQIFFGALIESLEENTVYKQEEISKLILTSIEEKFPHNKKKYSPSAVGDTIGLALQVNRKLQLLK